MSDALAGSPGEENLVKLYGDAARCPVCGAFAKTLPDPEHRWVCAVCGAPRVVMPEGVALPEESAVALREAANARRTSAMQRLMTWGLAFPAGASLLLAIVLAPASFIASGVLIGAGIFLALFSSRASRRAATERKRLRGAVERAYEAAIAALTAQNKTPQEVAAALRIAEADVETALAVQGHVRIADPVRIAPTVTETVAETGSVSETETESESAAGAEQKK
jgi:hypothetical protein